MNTLTPARTRLALLALALGGFGIGSAEFVASGLLPQIASDLFPQLDAIDHAQAIAQSGWMITAYAAGVVVGAPTIAVFAARMPRRGLLVALVAAFILGSIASALAPNFPTLVIARFVAALPHGAYFGIASLVAGSLMGPGKQGRGISFVLAGLTIANVIGVPAITFLGQQAGWRIAYVAVGAVFACALVAILIAVPASPGDSGATVKRELGGFRRGEVWLALLTGVVGFGGLFAVQSYIAPMTTNLTQLPAVVVPVVLVVFGLGLTVGNWLGGPFADHHAVRAIVLSFLGSALSFVVLIAVASTPVGLFVGIFLMAAMSSVLAVAIQTRLLEVARESQTLAAAVNHSGLNLGNSVGAVLGGLVIAGGFGYSATAWVGLLLCVPGLGLAVFGALVARRASERAVRQNEPEGAS